MNLETFPAIRERVASLLSQPTADLDPQAVYVLVKAKIDAEHETRRLAKGGGSTLLLNALLDIEQQLRLKVFGLPRAAILPAF